MKKVYSRISQPIADQSVKLEYGDIVFAGSGETHEEIGKCTAYVLDEPVYAGGDTIIFHPSIKCNSMFLGYLLNTPIVNQQKAQMGQGDAIVHISAKSLGKIELFLPNYEEQTAIATALSDTDALIDSLEKLIAKKQAIKQGAMQELLTGKRRLKGFSGEWKKISSIGDFGTFISGSGFPLEYQGHQGEKYPFYKVSDFNRAGNEYCMIDANNSISAEVANKLHCNIIKKNSIIFAKIGAAIALERKRIVNQDCCIDNNMMAFEANEKCCAKYIKYVFQQIRFSDYIEATALPSLSAKSIGSIQMRFPSKEEQLAIAEVLLDMDNEISALQKKLDKVRRIKQGMMTELLTGRIRLI